MVVLVDGIHDLGGMQGFGEVGYSPAEPVFRRRWEAVARALLVVEQDGASRVLLAGVVRDLDRHRRVFEADEQVLDVVLLDQADG